MSEEKGLSNRQQRIMDYIHEYMQENSRPPTIREIGTAVDISSTSVVNYNLTKLTEKGLLERDADVSRGLRLTQRALTEIYHVVSNAASQLVDGVNNISRLMRVPLLGNIKAGVPINVGNGDFPTYDEDDAIELSASMLPSGKKDDLFALRVSGDSMIDAMVNDGDIVIMQRQELARNGEMVAVWLTPDDTTTLKYFHHEGNRVRLQPANPTIDPIFVDPDQVRIQGRVMMVLRRLAN